MKSIEELAQIMAGRDTHEEDEKTRKELEKTSSVEKANSSLPCRHTITANSKKRSLEEITPSSKSPDQIEEKQSPEVRVTRSKRRKLEEAIRSKASSAGQPSNAKLLVVCDSRDDSTGNTDGDSAKKN